MREPSHGFGSVQVERFESYEGAAELGAGRIVPTGAFGVFGPEGRWLATARLPEEARFSGFPTERGVAIRGDTLWALAEDELGVQSIRRYEVPGLGRIDAEN